MNPNIHNLIEYNKADAKAKKVIKQTKKQNWKSFCMSINKNTPIGNIWSKLNSYKNRKRENEIPFSTEDSWVEDFHNKLAPPFTSCKPIEP